MKLTTTARRAAFLPLAAWVVVGSFTAPTVVSGAGMTEGHLKPPFSPSLVSGDYVWKPEISPSGPVVIIVGLSEQVLYVYRNGVRIGRATISSGKPGHRTPTGVFTILEKNVKHTSTIFRGASMPYMERLTWGGVALHGGNLPGYPASHACVRLPLEFAQKLYAVTGHGTTVVVTNSKSQPGKDAVPGFLFAGSPSSAPPIGRSLWKPEAAPSGPVSIVISTADGEAYVYRSGVEIGRTPMGGLQKFTGWYVYSALADFDSDGRRNWLSTAGVGAHPPDIKALIKQAHPDPQFLAGLQALIGPGASLIVTAAPVAVSSQGKTGVEILTTAALNP
jgi:hypothetical protein